MHLKTKPLDIDAGGVFIVVLNRKTAEEHGLHPLDRIEVKYKKRRLVCILNITKNAVGPDELGTYREVTSRLRLGEGADVWVNPEEAPESISFIKDKINRHTLNYKKTKAIIKDVVKRNLSDVEVASFVTSLYINGISLDEAESLSKAMAETGQTLDIGRTVYDKHSIGGIPGDKTSLLVVPIIAAAGLTIPKTSSRAITSPAGTADRMEVLAPVEFGLEEIKEIVKKTGGCMVWGGAVNLAPADDIFIKVEYPLGIDPLLLPSIMSKKKAVGTKYLVLDIPTGRGAKIKTVGGAHNLADKFIELGKRLGIQVKCAITYGEQPLGYAIGPALEAREALQTLAGKNIEDLTQKAINLAGVLLWLAGKKDGKSCAATLLRKKAEKKFREIVAAQGGNPKVKPEDIPIGEKSQTIRANRKGVVLWIQNTLMAELAKAAGAPKNKGAGILLHKKVGWPVKRGEKLFTIYAETEQKLSHAIDMMEGEEPMVVRKGISEKMLLEVVPKIKRKAFFILER
jgi:AMP phosphorylase